MCAELLVARWYGGVRGAGFDSGQRCARFSWRTATGARDAVRGGAGRGAISPRAVRGAGGAPAATLHAPAAITRSALRGPVFCIKLPRYRQRMHTTTIILLNINLYLVESY